MCRRDIKLLIDTSMSLGFLKEKNGNFILENVDGIFTTLKADTVRFCSKHFSNLDFKVYLYLMNKWNMNRAYKCKENYFFSHKEIAQIIGYSDNNINSVRVVKECLMHLENENLICYNHLGVKRPGTRGVYMELYKVNEYAKSQKNALKETIEQLPQLIDSGEISEKDRLLMELDNGASCYFIALKMAEKIYLPDPSTTALGGREYLRKIIEEEF